MEKEGRTYIDVLLPLALRQCLTYSVPTDFDGELQVGQRVLVPMGRRKYYAALIKRVYQEPPQGYAVKDFLQLLDEKPVLEASHLRFWEWMSAYYMATEGEVMTAALPSGFKIESETLMELHPDFTGDVSHLSAKEIQLILLLEQRERMSLREIEQALSLSKVWVMVRNLMEKNVLSVYEEVREKYRARTETCLCLAPQYAEQPEALAELFASLEKSARNRKQVDTLLVFMSLLRQEPSGFVPKKKLLQQERLSESSLQSLLKKQVLYTKELEISRLSSGMVEKSVQDIVLTTAQQTAMDEILEQWKQQDVVLLHGVTGSGKTEIYTKLIQQVISEGKQVLYLLPEIALTTQIINRLQKYFGGKVGVYHSRFNELERVEIWRKVQAEKEAYQVVIGARSALFLPFRNLGLIIVDEEHDSSYKQYDPAPRYHARDAAVVLSRQCGAKVLLGSATPSLESYYNVQRGKYGYVALKERYAGMELPEVSLVDLKKEPKGREVWTPYSQTLLDQIGQALERHEQVILFQNRRGFSLHLECDMCHHIPLCKNCDVALTYHKDRHQLRCHYCGYTENVPPVCPQCGSPKIRMAGFGTEKVEEELSLIFPQARIARLDYDSTRSKSAYQRIIYDFESQKIDILVGTQMVTKGLDFDHVSTVGILNADNMLFFPDFRAYERAFQVFSQVSGRAGRKFRQGKVLIQTFQPNHPIFQWVIQQDEKAMLQQLLSERKQFLYPPYCRFIKLTLKHKDAETVNNSAAFLAQMLKQAFGTSVLGPAYPPIPRVKNLYMKDIILKIVNINALPEVKRYLFQAMDCVKKCPEYRSVSIAADVDPY